MDVLYFYSVVFIPTLGPKSHETVTSFRDNLYLDCRLFDCPALEILHRTTIKHLKVPLAYLEQKKLHCQISEYDIDSNATLQTELYFWHKNSEKREVSGKEIFCQMTLVLEINIARILPRSFRISTIRIALTT